MAEEEAARGAQHRRQRLLRLDAPVDQPHGALADVAIAAGAGLFAEHGEQRLAAAARRLAQGHEVVELAPSRRACARPARRPRRSGGGAARCRRRRRGSTCRRAGRRARRGRSPGNRPRSTTACRRGRRSARPACRCPCRRRRWRTMTTPSSLQERVLVARAHRVRRARRDRAAPRRPSRAELARRVPRRAGARRNRRCRSRRGGASSSLDAAGASHWPCGRIARRGSAGRTSGRRRGARAETAARRSRRGSARPPSRSRR